MRIAAPALALLVVFAAFPAAAGKRFFLTNDGVAVADIREACGKGFHVASLWEILDFATLRYDAKRGRPPQTGSGGPPAGIYGWVETGGDDSSSSTPGIGNCLGFTSSSVGHNGTVVQLPIDWTGSVSSVPPWQPGTSTCNVPRNVWCKQN
jgi:hypothetical protein